MSETTFTGLALEPCGFCSTETNKVYHMGSPCPTLQKPTLECPHCGKAIEIVAGRSVFG